LNEAFENINFNDNEFRTVFNGLAAIMHLGNLKFDKSTLTDKTPCGFKNGDCFETIARLFEIPEEDFRKSLVLKTREVGKTVIESPLNEADAVSNKNALASNMYDRMFSWLVKRLNTTIVPRED
jgi:myosin heavy subunit